METRYRRFGWPSAVLALGLLAGCAHAGTAGQPTGEPVPSPVPPTERILITGSRIPRYVQPGAQVLPSDAPVRVFSRAQLLSTGRGHDLGAAMQTLDPSVGIGR